MADAISAIDILLDEYQRELSAQVSQRVVTRNFVGRDDMRAADLRQGVFTMLFEGCRPAENEQLDILRVAVIGQVELPEGALPLAVERAELAMLAEFQRFVSSPGGAEWRLISVATSHQIEAPFGWFYATCDVGPLNLRIVEPEGGHADLEVLWGEFPEIGPGHEADYKPTEEFFGG